MKNTLLALKITICQLLLFCSFTAYSQCNIDFLFVEITACEGDLFDVYIDFEHENTSDQFIVAGNGNNYGTFNYTDLPITLTSLQADCLTEYEFVVTDSENNNCTDFLEWGIVCCDENCALWDLVLTPSECDGNDFQMVIDFNYQGNTSPTFDWEVDNISSGTAFFADLPLTVFVYDAPNDILGFVVTETGNPNCFLESSFENPCFDLNECFIGQLSIDASECDGNEYFVEINFDYENTSDEFFLYIDGAIYGTYNYSELPIIVDGLESDCGGNLSFEVFDSEFNDTCFTGLDFETICCEEDCELSDLILETSECIGDEGINITIDFDHTGAPGGYFDYEVNGTGVSGTELLANLPITTTVSNTSFDFLTVTINISDDQECMIAGEVENPCYIEEDCFIGDLNIEVSECDGNQFFVEINFEYDNTSDDFFVNLNGENYGPYSYLALPVIIQGLEGDCQNSFEFQVYDSEFNGTCTSELNIGPVCCDAECEIMSIDFGDNPACIDGMVVTDWFIFAENTSEVGYDIYINDIFTAFVEYNGDGPYNFDIVDPETNYFTMQACDNDNPDCCYIWELMNPCFVDDCEFLDLVIETSECDGGFFEVTFDFDYSGNINSFFDWEIPGYDNGIAAFSDLPLTVLIENTNINGFDLFINENDNPDCTIEGSFENPCFGQECFIGELNIEVSECDGNQFLVQINFEYANTSNQFTVFGNGNNYGNFAYADLPITIDELESNCELEYEFVVIDFNNNDCASEAGIGVVCCEEEDCDLFDLVIETFECDENGFGLNIDFEYTGTTSDIFNWEIPGWDSGIGTFSNLPLFIGIGDSETEIFTILISEDNNPDCAIDGTIENPCFEGEDCFIGELNVEVSECDGNQFLVQINFDYANTSDEFTVVGNGNNYGTFAYADLPITIDELEGNCDLEFEFIVSDANNNDCASDTGIGVMCCEEDCEIISIDFGDNPVCIDGMIVTDWFIFAENTSEIGYDIYINNVFTAFVEYNGNGPYNFDIEAPDTYYFTIQACDNDNPECCYIWELLNPCIEDECELLDLVIETSECDGGFFEVTFDFDYNGNINSFFDWEIPGYDNGIAAFSDLPLTILIENTNINGFDLFINENDNPNCTIEGSFENPCFDGGDCFIGELNVDVSECDGNFFLVQINFEYENTSDQFIVNGNGNSYGTYSYDDLPITIDGLESDCNIQYEFVVHDVNNNDCTSATDIGEVCCDEECEIVGIDFGNIPICEQGSIITEWFIAGNNTSEVGYDIYINNDFLLFVEYNETNWYEFNIPNPGTEYFTIKACDNDNVECCFTTEFINPCFDPEECFIGELNIEVSECNENQFYVDINFDYANTSDQFFVNTNGENYGPFSYTDLPVMIDGLESNCEESYEFQVYDSEMNGTCTSEANIGIVCCEGDECFIGELNVEVSECEGNQFFVVINFEYENTSDQFIVNGNGNSYGTFSYSDLPITIDGLESDCDLQYEFVVHDVNNNDCASDVGIGEVCCEGVDCDLFDLDFDVSECDGNFFLLEVDFEYSGNTNESFTWEIPGVGSGTELFANLPISIEIENSSEPQFTFFANENDNTECDIVGSFGNPCYDSEECWIDAASAEVVLCEEELFDLEINFEYVNVGSTFTIQGNGTNYGDFSYADLPIILNGLSADCELEYEFVIIDSETENCSDFVEIGTICCEDFNQINGIQSQTIIDGNIFNVTFDINNTTLTGCKIDVYIGGEYYQTLDNNESSFMIGPFDCGQDDVLEIQLINTCSSNELTLMFDLSDIECITDVDDTLDGINLNWNMVHKTLSLEGEVPLKIDLQLINAQGVLILSENGAQLGWTKNLNTYPSGLYFVRIIESNSYSSSGLMRKILIY